jgi:hypothetical protein
MCYQLVYIVFDFHDETTLQSPKNIDSAFNRLFRQQQNSAFQLAGEDFESVEAAWNAAVRSAKRSAYITLTNDKGYEVTFSVVTSEWRRGYFSANRGQVTQKGADSLLEACTFFRTVLAADYGFGLVSLDTQLLDSPGEGDYGINTLYDYNFLSPRLVEKLGRSKFASLPLSNYFQFDDGGVLAGLSHNPLADKKATVASYQAAAAILGLPNFQQGC